MRIHAISDLHVDYAVNLAQVQSLSSADYQDDILIVAGDLSHQQDQAEDLLTILRERFARVFFTPGNHDLWVEDNDVEGGGASSLDRLRELQILCQRLEVEMAPAAVGEEVWILPLYGWYEPAFSDTLHADTPVERISRRWADFRRCRWPSDLFDDGERCRHFAALNEEHLSPPPGNRVVTFSHFLPRPELLPPVKHLRFKELPRLSGTLRLEAQLRAAGSSLHIFGHTHIPWDECIDGVRYLQNPLAYPHERKRRGQQEIRLVEVG